MDEILFLYTKSYPFGYGESFLENELEILSEKYSKIYILPLNTTESHQRELPKNIELISLNRSNYKGFKVLLRSFLLFLSIYLFECFKSKNRRGYIVDFSSYRSQLIQCIHLSELLQKEIIRLNASNLLHYSYWTEEWATALSILKRKQKINYLISRVHGYDLYSERRSNNIIPFRNFQLNPPCLNKD